MHDTPNPVVEIDAAAELLHLHAVHEAMLRTHAQEASQLCERLLSRKIIGQATGLLMRDYNLHEDAAFAVLCRRAFYRDTNLRDLASEMVEQANHAGTHLRSVADG